MGGSSIQSSAPPGKDRDTRRERHRAEVAAGVLGHARRLRWSTERLDHERERALRSLLAVARGHSPFHAERLADIDPEGITEDELSQLPVMTKEDMMASFGDVVTDRRITTERVDAHVAAVDQGGDDYLLGHYRTVATSGSSGLRSTYVYGWDAWTTLGLMATRSRLSMYDGSPRPPGSDTMSLMGSGLTTLSSAMSSFLADPTDPFGHLAMTTAVPDMVAALNQAQPVLLQAYPSALDLLVHETRAGRLHIAPRFIESGGELLTERTRDEVREIWGAEIDDCWGLSEGIYAFSCPVGRAMHLPDDLIIVEPVDLEGHPVPSGQPAAKIFVTNLYNHTQPLIRFEVPDGLTLREGRCDCGSFHRRIEALTGRNDQVFEYDTGVRVLPMALGLAIEDEPGVLEYQFRQTRRGVIVLAVTEPTTAPESLRRRVLGHLEVAGLVDPEVTVEVVDHIERLPSGKLRQFVALQAG